jgi:class III poly(R)-hydroxyalkanoic acid synthase PhaE subunit
MQWNPSMLNGWFGPQQQMAQDWYTLMFGKGHNGQPTTPFAPLVNPFWNSMLEQWQTLIQQGLNTVGEANAQSLQQNVKMATDQLFAGQEQLAQLTRLITEAWSSMAANGANSQDWQKGLEAYTAQLRQQMTTALQGAALQQKMNEAAQLYMQEMQKFSQPWLGVWAQMPHWWMQASTNQAPAATLQTMNKTLWDALGQSWAGLLNMPTLGLNREFQEKVNRWALCWLENQQALSEYQLLVGNVWLDAFAALMQKLIELAQAGKTIEGQRQLLDLWVEVADNKFIELFHSEAYATAQSRYVNGSMALRRHQRELLEVWLRQNDLPTRSDLDEAHRNLHDLRKEVKALKKALQAVTTAPASAPVAPATPASKTRRSKRTPTDAVTSV